MAASSGGDDDDDDNDDGSSGASEEECGQQGSHVKQVLVPYRPSAQDYCHVLEALAKRCANQGSWSGRCACACTWELAPYVSYFWQCTLLLWLWA